MGWGWYDTPADVAARIEAMFRSIEESETNQDDFVLAMGRR
jgi:hypothetical protein